MGKKLNDNGKKYKICIVVILLVISCLLLYYFHTVFRTGILVTHVFYLPIILACFWWKRKGIIVAVFSSVVLLFSHIFFRPDVMVVNDHIRAFMFIVIASVIAYLSECIFKENKALQYSEMKFRSLVETTSNWIWEVDKNGVYTYASPKVEDLLGYRPEEVIGKTLSDFMPKDEAERIGRKFRTIAESGKAFSGLENLNLHKDGRYVVLETSGAPILDASGDILGYRGIDRDITERKKADEVLKESEGKYRALIEATDTGFVILDAKGNVLDANDEYVRLTGHKVRKDILGRCVVEWTAEYDKERNAKEVKKCFEQGFMRNLEIDYVDKAGKVISIEINATAVKTKEGTIVITLCRDITERKQADEALQGVTEKLERKVDELQRYKKVTVGRELKMRELKKRIEDLEGSVKK